MDDPETEEIKDDTELMEKIQAGGRDGANRQGRFVDEQQGEAHPK